MSAFLDLALNFFSLVEGLADIEGQDVALIPLPPPATGTMATTLPSFLDFFTLKAPRETDWPFTRATGFGGAITFIVITGTHFGQDMSKLGIRKIEYKKLSTESLPLVL
jgi:hypothetical protein